jgi:tetratricopeptide (TPR) repeat protein
MVGDVSPPTISKMKTILLALVLTQSLEDVYKAANADFDAGKWTEAAAKYEQVLKEYPAHLQSRFNVAVCYSKTGRADDAITAYRTLLEQNDTIFEAHINLGLLLDQAGKRLEAGEQFEKALTLHPDDVQAELNVGMFYLRGNDVEKAYPHLIRVEQQGFKSVELYASLSDIEHTKSNETKSRQYLEKALDLDPANPKLLHQLAASYFEEKNYVGAIPILERLTKAAPANPDYFYLLGKSYEQLKSYPQALANLQQTLRMKPDYFEAYLTIGAVFYAQEDWARAAQALTRFLELRPREAVAHFVLATCLDNLGNIREALLHYNKFLEFDDGSNDARSFQARQRAQTLERRLKR